MGLYGPRIQPHPITATVKKNKRKKKIYYNSPGPIQQGTTPQALTI